MALKYPQTIVGIKTAHFAGPEWIPVEQAVIAGTKANIPVMVDFGTDRPTRPLYDLLTQKLRPGDIYTHMYSGLRHEQDPVTLGPSKAFIEGRKRGIYFDVGHGGGSFKWSLAVPMIKVGFIPDSISTDLHVTSMNGAMKDELNVADKIMADECSAKGGGRRDDFAPSTMKFATKNWATSLRGRSPMLQYSASRTVIRLHRHGQQTPGR